MDNFDDKITEEKVTAFRTWKERKKEIKKLLGNTIFLQEDKKIIDETIGRRNIIIHNNAIDNPKYLKLTNDSKIKIGTKLFVDAVYFFRVKNTIMKFTHNIEEQLNRSFLLK